MKATSVLNIMTESRDVMIEIKDLLLLQKEIFTISEVCSYTGFEKSYIYKLTSARKIPHFKSPGGKNLFFKRGEIIDWLTQIKVKTIDEINLEAKTQSTKFTSKS